MAKISDYLSLELSEFEKMSRSQLAKVVSRLASAANKRLKRFEQQEIESPAYLKAIESGGKFGTRGKTLNQLRAEYMRVSRFLQSKTSSLAGYKKVKKEMYERLGIKKGEEPPEELLKQFFEHYQDVEATLARYNYDSNQALPYAYDFWDKNRDMSRDEFEKAIKDKLNIEGNAENEQRDISDFFETKPNKRTARRTRKRR